MVDKKITELNNITGVDLVDTDEFVVVDSSADETRAITFGELKTAFGPSTDFVRITGDTMTGDLTVPNVVVSGNVDGRDVSADGTKLDGIEVGATADQTANEIKTAYESNADTNAFTDAGQSKLSGIEVGADVTDTANVTAAGALMDSEVISLSGVKTLTVPDSTTISTFGASLVDDTSAAAARTTLGVSIGTNVQAYDADLDAFALKTAPTGAVVGTTDTQTLTNKTLTAPSSSNATFTGGITEETGTMPAGTTPAIDPANGTVQEWTLTGNSSPTDSLADGEFVELLIQDGTAFTITWPTITWLTDAGVAPTLSLTGVTPVLVQKVGTTLYGRRTGDGG